MGLAGLHRSYQSIYSYTDEQRIQWVALDANDPGCSHTAGDDVQGPQAAKRENACGPDHRPDLGSLWHLTGPDTVYGGKNAGCRLPHGDDTLRYRLVYFRGRPGSYCA